MKKTNRKTRTAAKARSSLARGSRLRWTQVLPDRDGWWWHRHVVGSIPSDQPLNVMVMRGETVPSVYWRGQWRYITALPKGIRWQWSDQPIATPTGFLFGENDGDEALAGRKQSTQPKT